MTIRIEAYDRLPDAARAIREQVFIRERDWRPEFDEWDAVSVHLLVFDSDNDAPNRPGSSAQLASRSQPIQPSQNHPVATCRFYADPDHPDQPCDKPFFDHQTPRHKAGISARGCWPTPNAASRKPAEPWLPCTRKTTTTSSTNSAATGSLTRSMKAVVTAGWSRTYLVTYEGPPRCWASEPTARRQSDKSPRRGRRIR